MDALLKKSSTLQTLIQRSQPIGPLYKWVMQHPMARDLTAAISEILPSVMTVYSPAVSPMPTSNQSLKGVAWNVDRGKKTEGIIACLKSNDLLKNADVLFLTETDWGMARSDNRNVTADIAAALNMHAYFAPSYTNLTVGHGAERERGGSNQYGLHGNSILSRYPLTNLRVVKLKNATDKFKNVEVRIGQQTVILGDLQMGEKVVTLGCVHLDAYSSQRQRGDQLSTILSAIPNATSVLLGGDFNTSTYNAKNTFRTAMGLVYKTLFFGPRKIMGNHYLHPYKRFDRPVFQELEKFGYDYRTCNELGVGTFDIILGDEAMRSMASDKFPKFLQKFAEWAVNLNGGICSTRLDWFASKGITPHKAKVVRLAERLSDHHPIALEFSL